MDYSSDSDVSRTSYNANMLRYADDECGSLLYYFC